MWCSLAPRARRRVPDVLCEPRDGDLPVVPDLLEPDSKAVGSSAGAIVRYGDAGERDPPQPPRAIEGAEARDHGGAGLGGMISPGMRASPREGPQLSLAREEPAGTPAIAVGDRREVAAHGVAYLLVLARTATGAERSEREREPDAARCAGTRVLAWPPHGER